MEFHSYHPYDLRGKSIAINSITNGVYIYRLKDSINLCVPNKSKSSKVPKGGFTKEQRSKFATEAFTVFEQWRDAGYPEKYPEGYRISWKSVLIAANGKPCIFSKGSKYEGYFASATALKNGLKKDKGECECNDQVDPFEISALVLAANETNSKTKKIIYRNPARVYGAKVGDLVAAYNITNGNLEFAIIGDGGPHDNLGEGSVILNMRLQKKTVFPKNKQDTYRLATDKNIIICIIPNSKSFEQKKPYKQEDINNRVANWFKEQGFSTKAEIVQFFEQNKTRF